MSATPSTLTLVQALGPTIVLLLAVFLAAWLIRQHWIVNDMDHKPGNLRNPESVRLVSGDLNTALDQALALNSYDVHSQHDPSIRLGTVVKLAPTDYESVARDISQRFRQRETLSIDLVDMEDNQAVRLIDFCSGMVVACSGWIFRVADRVIVLSPPS